MPFKDLRQFIETLKTTGDCLEVNREVDWDQEIGAIGRRVCERSGPALLFNRIKDYPEGFRIFSGSLCTYRRVAIALDLPADAAVREIFAEYDRRNQHPVKPVVVKDGPCKENILLGDDADLHQLPAPLVHSGDGGRYIGTWSLTVCKDPDSDWTNWGMYRFMVYNRRHITGQPRLNSQLGMILHQKYIPKKKPMPMALVIGAEPITSLVASASYRKGVSEADYAGALRQQPVELVKCETSDLLVPATAEIVIEGEVLPDQVGEEGPFGEFPGYRTEGINMGVTCRIKAITYRNSPILSMIALGVPPDANSVATPIASSLAVRDHLRRHGAPVLHAYSPPHGVLHTIFISVKPGGRDTANKILDGLTLRRSDWSKVIMVDEDVDVFDIGQVLHAFSVKCHPIRGIYAREVEPGKAHCLTPCYSPEERRDLRGAIVLFDCTWPPEWSSFRDIPPKNSFDGIYSEEIKKKVLENWAEYGLKV
ncbi:MAG: UbiD family decarboxylase [Thermodesulfobacteriota bacterium]